MTYKFNEIKLDKAMYGETGKSFTQVLESLDPSENYIGTPYEGMDAFQRQLKRFDLRVRGAGSDRVEKFFSTHESAALFPEYISRSVKSGMEESNVLGEIAATHTKVESLNYYSFYSTSSADQKSLKQVMEGAEIPTTEIKVNNHAVALRKRGRMLVASYEAIRFQSLDLFSVALRDIGNQIMRQHLEDAVNVLINGDGTANQDAAPTYAIGTSPISGTAGTLTYAQMVEFWNTFDPYTMNTILAAPDTMVKLLNCTEFKNPLSGLNFAGTGDPSTPLGAKLIRCAAVPSGKLIGLDRGYALEQISVGDVAVEYDRLIDRQLERAAITSISGFAKLYKEASKVLTV